nr:MAG TPA: hypothetical protein [Caudoviricetes sp.]
MVKNILSVFFVGAKERGFSLAFDHAANFSMCDRIPARAAALIESPYRDRRKRCTK